MKHNHLIRSAIALLLVAAMTLSLVLVGAAAPLTEGQTVRGDANGDNAVNMKDVLLLRKYVAGMDVSFAALAGAPEGEIVRGDVNADNAINMKDVLLIRKYLAGMDVEFAEYIAPTAPSATETETKAQPTVTETEAQPTETGAQPTATATEAQPTETQAQPTESQVQPTEPIFEPTEPTTPFVPVTESQTPSQTQSQTQAPTQSQTQVPTQSQTQAPTQPSATQSSATQSSATQPSATQSSATQSSVTQPSATQPSATQPSATVPPAGSIKVELNLVEHMTKSSSDRQTRADTFYVPQGQPVTLLLYYGDVYHATNAVKDGSAAGWFDLKANGTPVSPELRDESNSKLYATFDLGTATTDIAITGEIKRYANSNKIADFKAVDISVNGQGGQAPSQITTTPRSTYGTPNFLLDPNADTVLDRITLAFYDQACTQYGITFHSYEELKTPVVQYVEGTGKTAADFASAQSVDAKTETLKGFMAYNYNPTDFTFNVSYDDRNNCTGLMPEIADYTHKAALPVLRYGTTYSYRVGDKTTGAWSPIYTFTTRPEKPGSKFSFIWMSDSQYTPYQVGIEKRMRNVLQAALSLCPNPDLMLHGGDFSDAGAYLWTYAAEVSGNADFFTRYPLMSASGNHDATGSSEIYRLINVDLNGTGRIGDQSTSTGTYYSYNYGDSHFTVLNISKDDEIDSKQLSWLQTDLANNNAQKWKFVYFHRPLYTCLRDSESSVAEDTQVLREQLAPLFKQYNVDVVLQAHVHMYSRTKPITDGKGTVSKTYSTKTENGYEYIVNPGAPIYTDTATAAAETEHIYRSAKDTQPDFLAKYASGKANSFAIYKVDGTTLSVDACYATDQGVVSYYEKFGIVKPAA